MKILGLKARSALSIFILIFTLVVSANASALTPAELAKKYTDPNLSAQEAADYYCQDPAHLPGSGSSVILPVGGVKIEDDGWVYVTLRSLGCGSEGERSVTFYGFNRINGQMVIDLSPSNAVNVTGSTITGAGGGALVGDDLWMADRGVNEADGSSGYDLKIRLKGSVFQESKLYEQAIKGTGLGWFVSPTCPTPLAFVNIDQVADTGNCVLTGGEKSNVANITYGVTVDVYPPDGDVEVEDDDPSNPDGSGSVFGNTEDSCSKVSGWVKDEDNVNSKLTVNVFVDSAEAGQPMKLVKIYTTVANGTRTGSGDGYGFVVPQGILNEQVGPNKQAAKLYFKAIGILENGDPVGGEDGLDFGEAEIKACRAPSNDNQNNNGGTNNGGILTPKTGALLGAGIILTAMALAGGATLYRQKKRKSSPEAKKAEK